MSTNFKKQMPSAEVPLYKMPWRTEVRHEDKFNKVDASKVRFTFHVMSSRILICYDRKYGYGIIIIMLDLSDSMSSSSDAGLRVIRIIICVKMKS